MRLTNVERYFILLNSNPSETPHPLLIRGVVLLLILGGPSFQNLSRPFLSQILGVPNPTFTIVWARYWEGGRAPRPIVRLHHCNNIFIIFNCTEAKYWMWNTLQYLEVLKIRNSVYINYDCSQKGPSILRCWYGDWSGGASSVFGMPKCVGNPCNLPEISGTPGGQYIGKYVFLCDF